MTFDNLCNGILKEAIFSNGIRKTWSSDSGSDSWEDIIEFDNRNYFIEADYGYDFTYDRGDSTTPPDTRIDDFKFDRIAVYGENPETGDFDVEVTPENNPDLYKALTLKAEEIIVNKIYERL